MRTEKIRNNHYLTEYVYDPAKRRNFPKRFKISEGLYLYIIDPVSYCERYAIPSLKPSDVAEYAPKLREAYKMRASTDANGFTTSGLDRFISLMLDGTASDRNEYPISRAKCKELVEWLLDNYEDSCQRYQRWSRHAPKLAWNWVNAMLRRSGAPDDLTPRNLGLERPE
jgi:hypothetical protein